MKSKFLKLFALAGLMASLPVLSSCDKEQLPEEDPKGAFYIDQQYLNYTLTKDAKEIVIPIETSLPNSKWFTDVKDSWIFVTKKGPTNGQGTLTLQVDENKTGAVRTAIVTVSTASPKLDYSINIKQYATNDLVVPGDIAVKPISATSTNHQDASSSIEKTYDDDVTTIFHSRWNPTGPFPFDMTYKFAGTEDIDYIEYVPREGGGNGTFQKFEVMYADDAQRTNYKQIATQTGETTFDFKGSSTMNKIKLPKGVKPTAIKFTVQSGVGNFVSCAEMRFMRKNPDNSLNESLLKVFTDLTCSELKPGITMADIEKLDPAFHQLGETLLNGTYDQLEKSFRVHEYQAYSDPTEWADKLMTKIYSNWDNPMGIAVKKGQKVMILVGDTHGNDLQVQILGTYQGTSKDGNYTSIQRQGHFVSINEGVNVITPDQDGQLFLMYTAVPSAPTSQPIKIHVPIGYGEVCGYFDIEEHKTDEKYSEIYKATQNWSKNPYFCIKGKRMLLYFKKSTLPAKIVDPINQWDNIITWQQNFMGVEDVRPAQWNNHVAGISLEKNEGGYMWASNWTMGFVEYKISSGDIMGLNNLNAHADNAWGPAHEMGHINQMAINWASTTESSNNLFSNYVLHRFGRYNSRGKGLYWRFGAVYEKDHSWASMNYEGTHTGPNIPYVAAENTYMGEETGIHMRLNWQLWNYYHRVRGDEGFFGRVFAKMRQVGLNDTEDCGRKQLEFAVACSEAAGEDLTDFFEAWGFFKPLSGTIAQYGEYPYRVSQSMIDNAKERMAKFKKPQHALEYIEDRSTKIGAKPGDFTWEEIGDLGYYTTYEQNLKVAAGATATVSSRNVVTKNCENAVALEIRVKQATGEPGEIRYASNYVTFRIPDKINLSNCGLYAVQADGTRILLTDRF